MFYHFTAVRPLAHTALDRCNLSLLDSFVYLHRVVRNRHIFTPDCLRRFQSLLPVHWSLHSHSAAHKPHCLALASVTKNAAHRSMVSNLTLTTLFPSIHDDNTFPPVFKKYKPLVSVSISGGDGELPHAFGASVKAVFRRALKTNYEFMSTGANPLPAARYCYCVVYQPEACALLLLKGERSYN